MHTCINGTCTNTDNEKFDKVDCYDKNVDLFKSIQVKSSQHVDRFDLTCLGSQQLLVCPWTMDAPLDLPPAPDWAHSTCCDLLYCVRPNASCQASSLRRGCCGCLDKGPLYAITHFCCIPCTFGRIAQVGAGKDYRFCCVGFAAGVGLGGAVLGHALLPCLISVRRSLVLKYGIQESYIMSCLHAVLCPYVSVLQMAMEVEEQEHGLLGAWGRWSAQTDMLQALSMDR